MRMEFADNFHFGFGRYFIFQADRPVASIHQQPPKAFALKILRGPHRGCKHAPGLSFFSSGGLDPGDRHHRAVDGPRHGLIGGLHSLQYLSQDQRLNAIWQRQTNPIDIGGSPDVAIFNPSKYRMIFAFGSDDSAGALLAVLAMM